MTVFSEESFWISRFCVLSMAMLFSGASVLFILYERFSSLPMKYTLMIAFAQLVLVINQMIFGICSYTLTF